jgi:hypothetical protein
MEQVIKSFNGEHWVPLNTARLCVNCEAVFRGELCPACASTSFMPLARWIDRDVPQSVQQTSLEPAPYLRTLLFFGLGVFLGRAIAVRQ